MPKPKRRKLETLIKGGGDPNIPWSTDDTPRYVVVRYSRTPGTGSVDEVKRGKYTYLRARVWCDNSKGVRVRREVYAKTETALQKKVKKLQESPAQADAKKLLLGDYLTHRFLPGMKLKVRPTTYDSYRLAVELHIEPDLGRVRLAALTPSNVVAWLEDLDATPRVKQRGFVVLKRALAFAVELGLLDRNQLASMKAPSYRKREQHILNIREVRSLLKAARDTEWFALIFTAIATSARRGELFGLQWRDVDTKRGFLYVRQGLGKVYDDETKSGYRAALTELKTGAARRRIDLSPEAIDVLRAHRASQIGKHNPHGLVFPNPSGGFIHPSNWYRRVWVPLVEKAELPRVTFHSLRHVGNTLLAGQGVSLALLQSRLGHSTPGVTLGVYSHVGATEGQRGAKIIGSLLGGAKMGANGSKRSSRSGTLVNEKPR